MFSYSCIKDRFDTYVLWNEDKSTLMKIVPQRGGIVSRFKVNNDDILYTDDKSVYDEEAIIRAGIPILFPICGSLDNNTYNVEGKEYSIKNHGFSRNFPWKVEKICALDEEAYIIISQESNESTLKMFPFKYKLIYKYTLKSDSLKIQAVFINEDKKNFDFYAGFHPYFYVPNKEKVKVGIPSKDVIDLFGDGYVNDRLNFNTKETNICFKNLSENKCSLKDDERNIKIDINYSHIYKNTVVWALEDKDFVCIEPWMAYTNAMNTKENLVIISPQKKIEASVIMKVSKL